MKRILCGASLWVLCSIPVHTAQAQVNAVRPEGNGNRAGIETASDKPKLGRATSPSSAATPDAPAAPAVSTSAVPVAPSAAIALTDIYRVGVGDVLDIRLLNRTTRDSTLYTVMEGGLLEFPLAGDPVVVAGLTTDEIGARLSAELKRRAVLTHPQMVVGVREYASHTIVVSGLVDNPGTKTLRREAMPLYAVLAEAQPRAEAERVTLISRATQASSVIQLGDPSAMNTLVRAGDVIAVAARPPQFYFIGGQVSAPGQKDFHDGLTLTQAILASGGATRLAAGRARISRAGIDGRLAVTEYNLREIETGKAPDPRLQPGDRIELRRVRW